MSSDNKGSGGLEALVGLGVVSALGYGIYRMAKSFGLFRSGQVIAPGARERQALFDEISNNQELREALDRANREAADAAWTAKVKLAEAEGNDVCWECETINPERCDQGHCLHCVGKCPACGRCGGCTRSGNNYCADCDNWYFDD